MPPTPLTIETVEMHTGGEPVRIVVAGYPPIPGSTLLAKRRQARERLDEFRRLLMFEPRGHVDMYGVIPVAPDPPRAGEPAADLAVLFMHNEGYSTMCGHAVIALGRWAVDSGLVPLRLPETPVAIQCPCVADQPQRRFGIWLSIRFTLEEEVIPAPLVGGARGRGP